MAENNSKQPFFAREADDVLASLDATRTGLSTSEAKSRLEKYGKNELAEGEVRSTLQKFLDQFKDLMIIILLIAAILSLILEGVHGLADAIIILAVVLINAVLGVMQENKAEDAINALKEMSSPKANLRRDGEIVQVDSKEIVPGDIVVLEAGDVVPADLYFYEVNSLKVEEAALTGESVPVEKKIGVMAADAGIGDRKNMGFSSTNVTYGRGEGVVVGTGMNTEVGNIADMLANTETKKTPLQEDQDKLSVFLTYLIIAVAVVIFVVGLINGRNWVEMLLTAISVAVAALPEGLPAITTIILALGTQKMADRNALVRKLPAVETLGSTEVICSDKTGTLTQNKMTIEKVYYNGQLHDADEDIDLNTPVLRIMNMANDTKLASDNTLAGDPTETAMVQYGLDKGFDLRAALEAQPRVGEVPFESDRKMSSTIHPTVGEETAKGKYVYMTKGAPDELLKRCNFVLKDGQAVPLTDALRQEVLDMNHSLAIQALRVLAMAYKYEDALPAEMTSELVENNLVFAGLVGEIDPERPEAKDAISVAKSAGIRTVMITGDHKDTAQAIATRLGIVEEGNDAAVTTGAHLNEIDDEELARVVDQYSVYARVSPEHKVRIVKAWQSHNKVVAMTGDGVNDAPSLQQADIGIGMGITGTEVSKGASDMVLADDNFATIVTAVEEGRKVFANIQKAIQFLLSANLGEVLTLFVATFLGWTILEPIHILWINLVTDTFPAIALGLEPAENDIMEQAPRGRTSNFLSNGVLHSIVYQGIFEGGATLFVYWYAQYVMFNNAADMHHYSEGMAFLTLGLIQLFHAFNCKSIFKSLFSFNPFENKTFNLAVIVSAVLLLMTAFVPGLNDIFGIADMTGEMWLVIVLASASVIVYVEIVKFILRASGFAATQERKKVSH